MLSISLLALSLLAAAAASKHCMCCEAHVGRCAFHDTGIACGAKVSCATALPPAAPCRGCV